MKAIIAFALLVAAICSMPTESRNYVSMFEEFKAKHGRKYASASEESQRLRHFVSNMRKAEKLSKMNPLATFGVNEFADLSHSEFSAQYLAKPVDYSHLLQEVESVDVSALPTAVDWRTKNAVTPIKNQGQCGSCWSFSTTGSVEGQHALATGTLVSLSEENLVECSQAEGNEGCNGGLMTQAFEYIIKNNGIDTEASYPYTSGAGVVGKCQFKSANVGAHITGYTNVASGSVSGLQNASATIGPISVAMDASLNSFQLYKSGIYDPKGCSSTSLDHGVLVVGYGNSGAYWIVKNSWGTTWGLQGYFEIATANNECGLATMASYPTGASN